MIPLQAPMDCMTKPGLHTLDHVPEGLLTVGATELHNVLAGPTLIHLPGIRPEPLFVSVLLHGNEDTGLRAIQAVLRRHAGRRLPRALSVFIGNVAAARLNLRRLPQEPDYNRIWPGTAEADHPLAHLMQSVVDAMRARNVFASLDIHNNTGINPHYACVNRVDNAFLHLARLFSRIVVTFRAPVGVQSAAFAPFCPAVTVECGKPGIEENAEHAAAFVEACLHLSRFPDQPVPKHDLDLYRTVAIVKVPGSVTFCFGDGDAALRLRTDIESLNFRDLPAGRALGQARDAAALLVSDELGRDITGEFIRTEGGVLTLKRPVTPAMLTTNALVIRQDCLCYFMERLRYEP